MSLRLVAVHINFVVTVVTSLSRAVLFCCRTFEVLCGTYCRRTPGPASTVEYRVIKLERSGAVEHVENVSEEEILTMYLNCY